MVSYRTTRITFEVATFMSAIAMVVYFLLNKQTLFVGFVSVTLGCLSLYLTYEHREKMEIQIKDEIQKKLTMFQKENETNISLIDDFPAVNLHLSLLTKGDFSLMLHLSNTRILIIAVAQTISVDKCREQVESNNISARAGNSASSFHIMSTTGTLGKGISLTEASP